MLERLSRVRERLNRLHGEECGQDLIEYALLAALIALAAVGGSQSWPAPSITRSVRLAQAQRRKYVRVLPERKLLSSRGRRFRRLCFQDSLSHDRDRFPRVP